MPGKKIHCVKADGTTGLHLHALNIIQENFKNVE